MSGLAFTAFYRTLARHRLYAAINIGGLAVGIAVFLLLFIYVRFENSFERWLPAHDGIYAVEEKISDSIRNEFHNETPVALWSAVSRDLPGTVGTRVLDRAATVLKNGVGTSEDLALVDPQFSDVFRLRPVAGSLSHVFDDPGNVVLTQETARKYFGTANPIGRPLTLVVAGKAQNYRVAAVVADRPRNTALGYDLLARMVISEDKADPRYPDNHQWNYSSPETYVRFATPAAADRFAAELPGLIARHLHSETPDNPDFAMSMRLSPITAVHFEAPGRRLAVMTLAIVGALTLLVAIVNYVNLATARAGLRAREVAMRKVLGADRRTVFRHYVVEAVATALLAGVLGLALGELAIPLVNAAADLRLAIPYFGANGVLLPLTGLVLLVGLAAGIYPALVLARFPVAAVLASARSPGGGRAGTRVREALVVAQFAIAIAFIIGTGILTAQTRHVRDADVGYDRQQLMLVMSLQYQLNNAQRDTIMHRLATLPGVQAVSVGNNVPGPGSFTSETQLDVPGQRKPADMRFFQTMPGFFTTMGARLAAGRFFDPNRPADVNVNYNQETTKPYNIVINRTALATLHIASPQAAIGRTFTARKSGARTIIGVVDDMRFEDARSPVPPTMYEFVVRTPQSASGILRFTGDAKALKAAAQAIWRQEAPEVPFEAKTVQQNLEVLYRPDNRAASLFTMGAVLAVAIGCVGLWGLASFNTARRIKEIGIRKTLGASTADIVRLLVGQFLRPVLLANLFAWPVAFLAMRTWLAGFNDRIALSPLFFVAATLLALAIAAGTVAGQSLRAARAAPAWALRHD